MKKLNWGIIFLFCAGGFLLLGVAYLLLRSSGVLYKLNSSDNKWIEYES